MAKVRRELVTHTFKGGRFDDHGVDLDVLPDLLAYKTVLVETAKELWRRNNPDRQRLPKNFEDSLVLKFYEVKAGSAAIPLMREIETEDLLPFEPPRDELDEAVDLVADAVDAAAQERPLPRAFPKSVIPLFANYGKNLRGDESFEQKPAGRSRSTGYSLAVKERLLRWTEAGYEDVVDVTGEIRAIDLDGCNFALRLDDGNKVAGKFSPEQEAAVTEALREHATQRLRVKGRAEFAAPDGKLRRIASAEEVTMQPAGTIPYDPTARPIWEVVIEIGASVPDEEWAKLPTDLSKNLDHYLYGAPKDEE